MQRIEGTPISHSLKKFTDPHWTARGEVRAEVGLRKLETLWFNTGTLCNITCTNCYIESSPQNDRLAYLSPSSVKVYLDEIAHECHDVRLIGFTGGEPFMNPQFPAILDETLARGFQTLTLSNAMKPMQLRRKAIKALAGAYGSRMRIRVSLDDWRASIHDAERGKGTFEKALDGLAWLSHNGVTVEVAARTISGDSEDDLRKGFEQLFLERHIPLDSSDPTVLWMLPEMNPFADPPEITEACWGILGKTPDSVMCANARMVVQRKGAAAPAVLACTLLPYDERFELGASLAEASGAVPLAHPYCATFCVLGGGSCGVARPGACSNASG
jgi:uncharacterized Fe-S cluster-containing radical SAM superfamily protein